MQGVLWFLVSITIGVTNDIISKYIGHAIPSFEIVFFRFLFGTITLLPFIIMQGKKSLYTSNKYIHLLRGSLLFVGILIWTYCIKYVHISTATVINFTIPIFVLFLARIILKEKVGIEKIIASIVGFIGVIIIVYKPEAINNNDIMILGASFLFALLDVINKKYVVQESMIAMLIYSNIVVMFASLPITLFNWVLPTYDQFMLLFLLGIGANLLLYCILKAFSMADASFLAPFRYTEVIISGILGFVFFNEVPSYSLLMGCLFIIPSTLFILRYGRTSSK